MGRPGLTQHRKFRRLASALKSEPLARGVLELLWDSCYESGDDYLGTNHDVENLARWKGRPGVLTRALVSAGQPDGQGFIEEVESTHAEPRYRLHDLWHHAPEYVKKRRVRELQRQQRFDPAFPGTDRRSSIRQSADSERHTAPDGGQRTPSPDWQNEVDRTPSPSPSPSPLSTSTREDARLTNTNCGKPVENSAGLIDVEDEFADQPAPRYLGPTKRAVEGRDDATAKQLLKLAHEALEANPSLTSDVDLTDVLKRRCDGLGLAYESSQCRGAIGTAIVMRTAQRLRDAPEVDTRKRRARAS